MRLFGVHVKQPWMPDGKGGYGDRELEFVNVHYRATAATRFGTRAEGSFAHAEATYAGYYRHHEASQTCNDCHDPHTLDQRVAECSACHSDVGSIEDFADIREMPCDFDGDGDRVEGIVNEITTLHQTLYAAIRAYATEISGTALL